MRAAPEIPHQTRTLRARAAHRQAAGLMSRSTRPHASASPAIAPCAHAAPGIACNLAIGGGPCRQIEGKPTSASVDFARGERVRFGVIASAGPLRSNSAYFLMPCEPSLGARKTSGPRIERQCRHVPVKHGMHHPYQRLCRDLTKPMRAFHAHAGKPSRNGFAAAGPIAACIGRCRTEKRVDPFLFKPCRANGLDQRFQVTGADPFDA
jgi:hypothetical protein